MLVVIFTDEAGRPIPKPERPAPDASAEELIAYQRALYAYNDRITGIANAAFDNQFRKAMAS